ncbi:MAG: (2Fe-2S) ferredoxin domain-containing protein [Clostridiales bacterium]|nr:(2Fe-2S) ferredoxin domain-containing protein [Clostridiales bacterium]
MKSFAELQAIRDRLKTEVNQRESGEGDTRIVVGMATCGIAAGARPVMTAFNREIEVRKLSGVKTVQTGCIGMCRLEPIVDVITPDGKKVTYVKVTPEKVSRIVNEHIVNGNVVDEFLMKE